MARACTWGRLSRRASASVRFQILEELAAPALAAHITLFLSLIKFERFEWAIEKATELGVSRIVPLRAERSEHGLELAARKRVERWAKIARAAAQQARRVQCAGNFRADRFARGRHGDGRSTLLASMKSPERRFCAKLICEPRSGESIAMLSGPKAAGRIASAISLVASALDPSVTRAAHFARGNRGSRGGSLISHAWEER